MIDKYDKGTIDIFDPEHWHPANKPAKKEEHKEQTEKGKALSDE